ncbi:MAG TPA: N-acetylglucosamine-6-phosphate deacetylase [Streptosporangiaceae bacterium]|nr:N-acetylglucosamine-6-phosphate deacetylase [Streptosporangiaceae bacterium]
MLIAAARIITASGRFSGTNTVLAPGYLTCKDGKIVAVNAGLPSSRPDVQLSEGFLLPGFIDLQVNGYFGVELAGAGADGFATVARRLPETGTTSFMPTFITSPIEHLAAMLRHSAAVMPELARNPRLARVLGIHLEGPFISPRRAGAHNLAWIAAPDSTAVETLIEAGAGIVKLVTMAPELDGAMAAIKQLTAAGVLVSVGHSDATAQQVSSAALCGAAMVTHLFNAQRPMHHREPGVVGQALADNRLTSSLIADLHHVTGQVAAIAFAAAPGRICLVTDAAACAGMPPGTYLLGGEPIELPGGDGAPPVRADGTFAGSALRMDSAVANMVATGIGLADAVAAATRIPADLIGRRDLGRLAPGAAADLAWLSDDLRTVATWVDGHQVYGPHLA